MNDNAKKYKILSFQHREAVFLAISIHSLTLEIDSYVLELESFLTKEKIRSNPIEPMIVPRFQLDFSHKQLNDYLQSTFNSYHTINLYNSHNEKVLSFEVDFGYLKYISKDLSSAEVYHYPFIFFEFSTGIYTTTELYLKNKNIISTFPKDEIKIKETIVSIFDINIEKKEGQELGVIATYMQNFKQYFFFINNIENREKKIFKSEKSNFFLKHEELLKTKKQIKILEEKKEQIEKRTELLKKINQQVKMIINQKNQNLLKSKECFEQKKNDFKNDKTTLDNEINKIPKYNFIVDTLINKKMIEIIFAFFNKQMEELYSIPFDYSKNPILDKIEIKYPSSNDIKKIYSSMMGNVANLLNYISKSLNISLKYPFFINGSKTLLIKSKKNFIQLFLSEDRVDNFLNAVEYLKVNLREIINYLATYTNVISKDDYEKIIKIQTTNFFNVFVEFSQTLYNFAKSVPE